MSDATPALYDRIGVGYSHHRRPDPRIASRIAAALGSCRTVVNIGAGSGSYEPQDRRLVAVEPSWEMLSQRAPWAAVAVRAVADRLPFCNAAFDAAMAVLTLHHWPDWRAGLGEMRRVAPARQVLLTWDPAHAGFWLVQDYFPELLAIDQTIFPSLPALEEELGPLAVQPVPVPWDCVDGFLGAYWRRPDLYLDAEARGAISTFCKVKEPGPGLERLRRDLADATWQRRYGALVTRAELDIGYRLVVANNGG